MAHDLSNSIETIMQASYLLSQAKLDDANKKWVELIDTLLAMRHVSIVKSARSCVRRAKRINRPPLPA